MLGDISATPRERSIRVGPAAPSRGGSNEYVQRLGRALSRRENMTPHQVAIVQDSFKKVIPIAAIAADLFYDRLFVIAPDTRPLFPDDLREQKKKLMTMLAAVVTNLHKIEEMLPTIQDLGRRHVNYGVTAEHYKVVGQALLWTLEQGLGDDFTPSVKAAWREAYAALSGAMTSAAAVLPIGYAAVASMPAGSATPPRM
jgi:hemoglobin-like flavoprotein